MAPQAPERTSPEPPEAAAEDPAEVTRTGSWLRATTEGAPLKRTADRSLRAARPAMATGSLRVSLVVSPSRRAISPG